MDPHPSLVMAGDKEITSGRTVKTRRSHTKSRNGCAECKRRHVRCDERQPVCTTCEIAERVCFFPPRRNNTCKRPQHESQASDQQQRPDASSSTPNSDITIGGNNDIHASGNNTPPAPTPTIFDCHSTFPGLPGISPEAIYTTQHMVLLHYAGTVPNFSGPSGSVVDIAIRHAMDSPYLLDEILAFTAFHMAHVYPASARPLRDLATELQTRALATFTRLTETIPNDDRATAVPRFLFSAIVAKHFLADTLTHHQADFREFIDRLASGFDLSRGVMSVTPGARHFLSDSEVQPFMNVVLEAQAKVTSKGSECGPLSLLLADSDLSEGSTKACRDAVDTLQWSFDICRYLNEEDYPQAVSVFSVRADATFADMMRKHRPEALVILAYFGVLLYRCRSFWAFRGAGAALIRAIAGRLGGFWQDSLAWPLRVLENERDQDSLIQDAGT